MNSNELKTFLAILDTGSLVRAAQVLNVTQSTVTARLKALEEELGQPLINRHKSGATLTAAGMRLQRYAQTIDDLWRQARQETALPDGLNAVCNIACEPDLWQGLAERYFAHLRRHHPRVAISVWQGSAGEVANWMAQGKSDLAFSYSSTTSAREDLMALAPDRLCLMATRPDAPVITDPGYVFVEAGAEFGRDHAATYADRDTSQISFNTAAQGLAHLLAEGGSAYLPERVAAAALAEGQVHRLEAASFQRAVFLKVNRSARKTWPWFEASLAALPREGA